MEVLEICHRVVLSETMSKEWNDHQLSFFQDWRTEMVRKGKVAPVSSPPDEELRENLQQSAENRSQVEALLKDAHLVESALKADGKVVSVDAKARQLFSNATAAERKLRRIVWVNPEKPEEQAVSWLRSGAKNDQHRQLGSDD